MLGIKPRGHHLFGVRAKKCTVAVCSFVWFVVRSCSHKNPDAPMNQPNKVPLAAFYSLPPSNSSPLRTARLLALSIILSFLDCYINGIVLPVSLWDWFFTLCNSLQIHPSQVAACTNISFLFLAKLQSSVCLTIHTLRGI
jgi:hypothetical protein